MQTFFLKFPFVILCVLSLQACLTSHTKVTKENKSDQTSYYSYHIDYPSISGKDAETINDEINKFLKKQVYNIAKQSRIICDRDNEPSNLLPELDISYEILEDDEQMLTIRFSSYIEWNNENSPSLYYDCFNYSFQEHKFIDISEYLKNLFPDQEKAVKAIKVICEQKLFNNDEIYCRSILKSEKEMDFFENLSIVHDQLIFKFDNISLETNMCGNPEVAFSINELKNTYSNLAGFK